MLRRNLLHARRYPSLTLNLLLTPIMLLLLFVYIFGDTMSMGIGGGGPDRAKYIAYIVPGLLLMTIGCTVVGTAISVSNDMTEGIIARFRTMAIHRGSVIIGHVVGSVLQSILSVVLVGAVGVAIGFRSTDATALEWFAAFGLLVLFALALTWIAVGMGLVSPNAEAASNNAMPLILLPLLSSAFVPLHSMPGWFQPIAAVPALHPRHRDPARPAARHRDRQQRLARHRLVPRPHRARLLLVEGASSTATRSADGAQHQRGGRLQLVAPQGGVLRHRVGVRRPVGVLGRLPGPAADIVGELPVHPHPFGEREQAYARRARPGRAPPGRGRAASCRTPAARRGWTHRASGPATPLPGRAVRPPRPPPARGARAGRARPPPPTGSASPTVATNGSSG